MRLAVRNCRVDGPDTYSWESFRERSWPEKDYFGRAEGQKIDETGKKETRFAERDSRGNEAEEAGNGSSKLTACSRASHGDLFFYSLDLSIIPAMWVEPGYDETTRASVCQPAASHTRTSIFTHFLPLAVTGGRIIIFRSAFTTADHPSLQVSPLL